MAQGQVEVWQRRDDPNITVQAIRLNEENVDYVAGWVNGQLVEEIDPEHPDETQSGINVMTPTGMRRASLGMYVIAYGGNVLVSHNRPFEMVYEPVSREATPLESAGDARKERGFADPFDSRRFGP